jgi:hypothetical protein
VAWGILGGVVFLLVAGAVIGDHFGYRRGWRDRRR